MVNQNKIFSLKIKRQAKKNVIPSDVERTVDQKRLSLSIGSDRMLLTNKNIMNGKGVNCLPSENTLKNYQTNYIYIKTTDVI